MGDIVIVVVDDNIDTLELMDMLLAREGYQMIPWDERDSAYAMIRRTAPDLVVLNIPMEHPDSGWMGLEMLRLDPNTQNIPVLVCCEDQPLLQSKAAHLRERRCDVLVKPFTLDDLRAKIGPMIGASSASVGATRRFAAV